MERTRKLSRMILVSLLAIVMIVAFMPQMVFAENAPTTDTEQLTAAQMNGATSVSEGAFTAPKVGAATLYKLTLTTAAFCKIEMKMVKKPTEKTDSFGTAIFDQSGKIMEMSQRVQTHNATKAQNISFDEKLAAGTYYILLVNQGDTEIASAALTLYQGISVVAGEGGNNYGLFYESGDRFTVNDAPCNNNPDPLEDSILIIAAPIANPGYTFAGFYCEGKKVSMEMTLVYRTYYIKVNNSYLGKTITSKFVKVSDKAKAYQEATLRGATAKLKFGKIKVTWKSSKKMDGYHVYLSYKPVAKNVKKTSATFNKVGKTTEERTVCIQGYKKVGKINVYTEMISVVVK